MSNFSIEETLKSLRFSYRLLLLTSAATILLWMSQESNSKFSTTQLRTISQIDYQELRKWAEREAKKEIENSENKERIFSEIEKSKQLNNEQLKFVRTSLDNLFSDLSDPPSFTIELPENGYSISDLTTYYKRNPRVHLILPDVDRTVKGYLYATKSMINKSPWKNVEITYLKNNRKSGLFRVSVSSESYGSNTGSIGDIPERNYEGNASLSKWISLQSQPIYSLVANTGKAIFLNIPIKLRDKYGDKTPEQALSNIEEEKNKNQEKSQLNVIGLGIPYNAAAVGVPLLGGVLALYLWISIGHLKRFSDHHSETIIMFPWLGLVMGRLPFIMFVISVVIFPAASFSGLIYSLWEHSALETRIFNISMYLIMVVFCISIVITTSGLRKKVYSDFLHI